MSEVLSWLLGCYLPIPLPPHLCVESSWAAGGTPEVRICQLPIATPPRPLRDVDGPQPEFAKDKTTGWVKLMTCSCWLLNFVQIQCWPWQILSLQNLVLEKVASTI